MSSSMRLPVAGLRAAAAGGATGECAQMWPPPRWLADAAVKSKRCAVVPPVLWPVAVKRVTEGYQHQ